jgi:hypothetical protein
VDCRGRSESEGSWSHDVAGHDVVHLLGLSS